MTPAWPTTPCKGCGRPIVWARNTQTEKRVPLDPKPVCYVVQEFDGELICGPVTAMVTHFATCPKASDFSKGGGHAGAGTNG